MNKKCYMIIITEDSWNSLKLISNVEQLVVPDIY